MGVKKMQEQTQIKERIEELRKRYKNLQRACNYWTRISPETIENYSRKIESLQSQLNPTN